MVGGCYDFDGLQNGGTDSGADAAGDTTREASQSDATAPDAAPTCTDSKKNGAETDVDCGGGTCPACANTKECKANTDCTSGNCDTTVTPNVCKVAFKAPGTWVTITAGTFQMGSPDGTGSQPKEDCRWGDETPHQVKLTGTFEMMTTEVTQGQFKTIMGYDPSWFGPNGTGSGKGQCASSDCPVERVNWHEAAAYANALSAKANLTQCYTCNGNGTSVTCLETTATKGKGIYSCKGFRLPTEAEWEYAYRAGSTTAFYNGGISSCSGTDANLDKIGWYDQNSGSKTHPVGKKTANAWGLYDMAGNVWEWCHDWYTTYPSTSVTNPVGTAGSPRVYRGGSWSYFALYARAAYRIYYSPGYRYRLPRLSPVQVRSVGTEQNP